MGEVKFDKNMRREEYTIGHILAKVTELEHDIEDYRIAICKMRNNRNDILDGIGQDMRKPVQDLYAKYKALTELKDKIMSCGIELIHRCSYTAKEATVREVEQFIGIPPILKPYIHHKLSDKNDKDDTDDGPIF